MYRSKSKLANLSKLHVPLLDIRPEGKLQREIKDIMEELDIMLHIYKKQREVMRRFCKHTEHILDPEGRWKEGAFGSPVNATPDASSRQNSFDESDQEKAQQLALQQAERREQLSWFRLQSRELLSEVDDRIDELEGLRKAAESTAQSVGPLSSCEPENKR